MPTKKKPKAPAKRKAEKPATVTFHYIKSPQHRTIHVDGAYGSVTPQGAILVCFFNERFPIPRETTHDVLDGNVAGEPRSRESKEGIVREIDVAAVFRPSAARRVGQWLIDKADEAQRLTEQAKRVQDRGE